MPAAAQGLRDFQPRTSTWCRRRRRGPIAPLGHELVELRLVLRHAQALQEFAEFALLFLEPLQRLGAIFVERAIAARSPTAMEAVHLGAHAVHLVLHAFLPLVVAASAPTAHLPAPDRDAKDDEAERPPEHEGADRQHDPHGMPGPWGPAAGISAGISGVPPVVAWCRRAHRDLQA